MEPWRLIVYVAEGAHNETAETLNGAEKAHKATFENLGLKVGDSCHFDEDEDLEPLKN
jgi:hypothetical protein